MVRRLLLLVLLVAGVLLAEIAWALLVGSSVPYEPPSPDVRRTGAPDDPPLRFVVLGDSTAAGQGAREADGIAVAAAAAIAARGLAVSWQNLAVSGATWRDVREGQLAAATAARADIVLVSAGANDTTSGRRGGAVRDDVRAVVQALRRANPRVRILITGVPDMGSVPRLPQPLRWLVGERAETLDGDLRDEGGSLGVTVIPILQRTGAAFRKDPSLFSVDRFHPDAAGYALWSAVIAESLGGLRS